MLLATTIFILGASLATCGAVTKSTTWSAPGCGRSKYFQGRRKLEPTNYIIGGADTQPYEFPWQVSIRTKSGNDHFCGGSIIRDQWILTAAHCMVSSAATVDNIVITVGEWNSADDKSTVRRTMNVAQIKVHEGYDEKTMRNDIALIKLTTKITFNSNIQPVCAPNLANKFISVTAQCYGWGTIKSGGDCCPPILQSICVTVMRNDVCNTAIAPLNMTITPDMLCATDDLQNTVRDSCQGDSGGPLTINKNNVFSLIGIVSWGEGCAEGFPGVYTRVAYFNNWILESIL